MKALSVKESYSMRGIWQRITAAALGVTLAAGIAFCVPATAHAVGNENSVAAGATSITGSDNAPTVNFLENGAIRVVSEKDVLTASYDEASNTAKVIDENGVETIYDFSESFHAPAGEEPTIVPYNSGVTCTMLLWGVDLVHSGGWMAAAAILAATGPPGAATAAMIWAMGSGAFLAFVSTQC